MEQSGFLWGLKFQVWRSSVQGMCEPVAAFSLILGAGEETQWQKAGTCIFTEDQRKELEIYLENIKMC